MIKGVISLENRIPNCYRFFSASVQQNVKNNIWNKDNTSYKSSNSLFSLSRLQINRLFFVEIQNVVSAVTLVTISQRKGPHLWHLLNIKNRFRALFFPFFGLKRKIGYRNDGITCYNLNSYQISKHC